MRHTRTQNKAETAAIGSENTVAIVIDNFHPDPQALVDAASHGDSFAHYGHDFYPGTRKPLDKDYRDFLQSAVEKRIRETYTVSGNALFELSLCAYSLTTTRAHKLRPIQQLPHIDSHETTTFAVVHYICDERFGGTSFYRHRSSGFEFINHQRLTSYFAQLKSDVMNEGAKPPAYICKSNALFEKIGEVELKFNRALIYPSNVLHSGNIDPALGLSSDPRRGRLTINSFIEFPSRQSPPTT